MHEEGISSAWYCAVNDKGQKRGEWIYTGQVESECQLEGTHHLRGTGLFERQGSGAEIRDYECFRYLLVIDAGECDSDKKT